MRIRRHLALIAVLLAGVALPGCAALRSIFQSAFKKPDLRFKTVNLKDASLTGLNLETIWTLDNPNAIGLSLAEIDYALFVEDKQIVAGKPRRGLQIPPSDRADLNFPANIKFQDLAPTLTVFLNQETARYRAQGHIGVQTPIGVLKFPLKKEGVFEVPKIPQITFEPPRITRVDVSGATVEIPLTVTNRNSYPLPIGGITGMLAIGGANVGNISTGNLGLLQGKTTQTVKVPLTISFANALNAANAIRQGQGNVALSGKLQSGDTAVPIVLNEFERFLR